MIRIAVAAIIAVFVTYDATVPAATGLIETIERPRGLKGDRLPIHPPGAGCAEAVWPHYQGECVSGREQPADQMPWPALCGWSRSNGYPPSAPFRRSRTRRFGLHSQEPVMSRVHIQTAAAVIGAMLTGTAAHAEPLGYAPWFGPQRSIFQQVLPELAGSREPARKRSR